MIGDGDIFVTQFARGFGHFLNGAFAVAGRRVHVEIALDVLAAHQVRQAVAFRGFDLTGVFADFRRDEVQLELGVDFFFRAPGDAALALQRGQRVFVQSEAHIIGAAAQIDVVFARSGEVQQSSAKALLIKQPHVHLDTGVQREANFIFAVRQNLVDSRVLQNMFGDGVDVLLRSEAVGKRKQQVKIADGFFSPAQGARRRDGSDALSVFFDVRDHAFGRRFRRIQSEAAGRSLERLDGLEDVLLAFFTEARHLAQFALKSEFLDVSHGGGLEVRPQKRHLLRSQRLQVQNIKQRNRIFLQQLLPQTVVAGLQDFLQMLGHALADARQLFQLVGSFRQFLDRFVHSGN